MSKISYSVSFVATAILVGWLLSRVIDYVLPGPNSTRLPLSRLSTNKVETPELKLFVDISQRAASLGWDIGYAYACAEHSGATNLLPLLSKTNLLKRLSQD